MELLSEANHSLVNEATHMPDKSTFFAMFGTGFMFRFRGYGLCVNFKSPILFSERNGYNRKLLRIGSFAIGVLKP